MNGFQMFTVGIPTFFLLLSVALAVAHSTNPTRVLGYWQSLTGNFVMGVGAGISVVVVWKFCVASGYPSRLDIYALAASLSNALFYSAAVLGNCARSISAKRKKHQS